MVRFLIIRFDQTTSQSLRDAITEFMHSLSKEEYRNMFDKWIEMMQWLVDNQGHDFVSINILFVSTHKHI